MDLLWIVVFIVLLILFFYNAAVNKQQASFVKEGTIEFVVSGETLLRVLENVREWVYWGRPTSFTIRKAKFKPATTTSLAEETDEIEKFENVRIKVRNAIVPDKTIEMGQRFRCFFLDILCLRWYVLLKPLERFFGFFWVSLIWPQRRIHTFKLKHKRKESETKINYDDPMTKWITEDEGKDGGFDNFLLWRFPRPIIVHRVEFKDLFEADVLVRAMFQVVIPELPIFVHGTKFHELIESAVGSAVIDFARGVKFEEFIQKGKTAQGSSFFWKAINRLNLPADATHHGGNLITTYGIWVFDAWVEHIQLAEKDERVKKATKQREIARLEGEASLTAVRYEARVIKQKAEAEARALNLQKTQGSEAILIAKLQKEAIAAHPGTLVLGGGVPITLPATPSAPPPPSTPPAESGGSGTP